MLPAHDTEHVAEGLAWLIGQYKGKLNITSLTTALLNRVQEAEDMLWDVMSSQLLTRSFPTGTKQGQQQGPPDQALLQLADLSGCPVGTLTTNQLLFLLAIWRLARKSKGRSEDILRVLAAGFGAANFSYAEFFPAAFQAWVLDMSVDGVSDGTLFLPLLQAVTMARDPGVYGVIAWGTWPTETFYFADDYGGSAGSGLQDDYSPIYPEGLLAEVVV